MRKRAWHVVTECGRVLALVALLEENGRSEMDLTLSANDLSLRDDIDVSCPETRSQGRTAARRRCLRCAHDRREIRRLGNRAPASR